MPFGPKNVTLVQGVDMGDLKAIPGADGYYITRSGRVFSIRELSMHSDPDGYRRVNAGRLRKGLHQLLALVFLPSPSAGQNEVRHLDGNPKNNSIENLAWGTRAENAGDMAKHGTVKGEGNANSKLTVDQVIFIKSNNSISQRRLSKMFGVSKHCIFQIKKGINWGHVKLAEQAAVEATQ